MAKKRTTEATTPEASVSAKKLVDRLTKDGGRYVSRFQDVESLEATKTILDADPLQKIAVIRECVDRVGAMRDRLGPPNGIDFRYMNLHHEQGFPNSAVLVTTRLLRQKLPFTNEDLLFLIQRTSDLELIAIWNLPYLETFVKLVESAASNHPLSQEFVSALGRLEQALARVPNAPERKLKSRVAALRNGPLSNLLEPGEAWSDVALLDLESMPEKKRAIWLELIAHCQHSSSSAPSAAWLATAENLLKRLSKKTFLQHIFKWFPLVDKARTRRIESWSQSVPDPNQLIIELHTDILKGLVWCSSLYEDADVARSLTRLAISTYRKVPRIGPRAVKIGNACVYALGALPGSEGVAQLAILKVRVKFGTAQKGIEKALVATAERVGIPREDLEEMSVPSYGLTEVGRRREEFGDYVAELIVTGRQPELHWRNVAGKTLKSAPASVKREFAEDLQELKQATADIDRMLPAQSLRIEQAYLQQKLWAFGVWRDRYLDHPLVGTLARRLIWQFHRGREKTSAIFHDGRWIQCSGEPLHILDDNSTVRLWHPLDDEPAAIAAWRDWLERHEVQQPFKQAHREIYVLTDAERHTETYSNRFAAHVIRQHQFNALCGARGWKNMLRLLVDADFPPAHLLLDKWKLRAEFWVQGIGSEYGSDINDAGTYNYLATDQVRFYSIDAAVNTAHAGGGGYCSHGLADRRENHPLDLASIPAIVFSEVMRDVDLFVGVASVGNDPNWSDGGPNGRYRDYWQSYSFGALGTTAKTRKEVLERLIPRLKIADRCSFSDRFLVVRGQKRSYRIHLGSGNILMDPDDKYLCIVPQQSIDRRVDKLFLPFDGDDMMSIILSKALLLAEDSKITDPTILSQIKR